jgi:2,3-bisphosphoglycerate-dependent phosphoglycerate mutase
MTAKYTLIILRHGNSTWNQENLFTGWVDVELSDQGRAEAKRAGDLLVASGLKPELVFTSRLKRAIHTAEIALAAADRSWIDVQRDWRLNERHYGALQGKDKAQTLAQYGPEMFQTWRRSFDVPPPPIEDTDQYSQANDERYAELGDQVPKTECLKDVLERMLPFWLSDIQPALKSRKTVLVTAHGNSLRALVKHLDGISDEDIAELNIPTGIPLVYELDEHFKPIQNGGRYLDPDAAVAGAAAVAAQGNKK